MSNSNPKTKLMCKINRTVFGELGKQIQADIDHHIEHCGIVWTTERIKTIRNAAMLLKENRPLDAILMLRNSEIRYDRHSGKPKGPWGKVVTMFTESKNPATVKRAAAVLRSYTALVNDVTPPKDVDKVVKSISEPPIGGADRDTALEAGRLYILAALNHIKQTRGVKELYLNIRREDFSIEKLRPFTAVYSPIKVEGNQHLRDIPYGYAFHSLMTTSALPSSLRFLSENAREAVRRKRKVDKLDNIISHHGPDLDPFWSLKGDEKWKRANEAIKTFMHAAYQKTDGRPISEMSKFSNQTWRIIEPYMDECLKTLEREYPQEPEFVGRIQLLNEPGCKTRAIAIPNAWIQLHMYPLHAALETFTKENVSSSFVHRQPDAAEVISYHMQSHRFVQSVDLSSATDRFPIELQTYVLETLGQPAYSQGLKEISQSPWNLNGQAVSYAAGQPMGLYGSFALFHLTHALLLKGIELEVNRVSKPHYFMGTKDTSLVLGDDVVISDKKVLRSYKAIMKKLEVPISEHKSFGNDITEFAGFTIMNLVKSGTRRKNKTIAFRPLKFGNNWDKLQQLDLLSSLGKASLGLSLSSKRKTSALHDAYKVFITTLDQRYADLSPIIPQEKDDAPTGIWSFDSLKDLTIQPLYLNNGSKYPEYSQLVGGEPIMWDGFKDVSSETLFHRKWDSKPTPQDAPVRGYEAPPYRRDPLIRKVLDEIEEDESPVKELTLDERLALNRARREAEWAQIQSALNPKRRKRKLTSDYDRREDTSQEVEFNRSILSMGYDPDKGLD